MQPGDPDVVDPLHLRADDVRRGASLLRHGNVRGAGADHRDETFARRGAPGSGSGEGAGDRVVAPVRRGGQRGGFSFRRHPRH